MKRSGFTMIELIFVIVILGILAAVALPKFIGVSEQAQAGKLKAYVGSLNRTVAPALWSKSISSNTDGNVTSYGLDLNASLAPLQNIQDDGSDMNSTDLNSTGSRCGIATATAPRVGDLVSTTTAYAPVTGALIGGNQYLIKCINGNATHAPVFWLEDNATVIAI